MAMAATPRPTSRKIRIRSMMCFPFRLLVEKELPAADRQDERNRGKYVDEGAQRLDQQQGAVALVEDERPPQIRLDERAEDHGEKEGRERKVVLLEQVSEDAEADHHVDIEHRELHREGADGREDEHTRDND